ncbi:aspartate--tRNA(Asn) ligase [Candidatus Methanomassiliicoccus intestinalis]|uniref:aspartate--tRNA(Asn) ligase n=2 Tax=Candidatus Methanomassiliicoccus intestinalis TaxID=1406512 RepID=UPI0037DC2B2A
MTLEIITRNSQTLSPEDAEKPVRVKGWAQEIRNLGGISFLIIRDRYGTVQVTAPKKKVAPEIMDVLTSLARESVVEVCGIAKASNQAKGGAEVIPEQITVLSSAASPLPLGVIDKVNAEMDTRYDHRFMDLRKPEARAVFEIKSQVLRLIDEYLLGEDFIEVFSPKIVASGAEGGATLFKLDYFGKPAYLAQSPQLYKQMMMSTGLDRVFEIGPAFRAEPSDTVRHVSEFISFDGEMAYIDSMNDVLQMLEGCIQHVITGVKEKAGAQLEILGTEVTVPKAPYPIIEYKDAVEIVAQQGMEIALGDDLGTEGEKLLGAVMAEKGYDMYWIVEYPEEAKPFYIMEKEGTPYSYSFDLDYKGQEISSGGQREHRYDVLVERIRKKGLEPNDFNFYLDAFKYGMPPHGGWGIGVERLVQKMLSLPNVREAVLFPRDRMRLVP